MKDDSQKTTQEDPRTSEQFYIFAASTRPDDRSRVLKHGESFAVFDRAGAIRPAGLGELGLFHEGTRFLSGFEPFLEDQRLQLLKLHRAARQRPYHRPHPSGFRPLPRRHATPRHRPHLRLGLALGLKSSTPASASTTTACGS